MLDDDDVCVMYSDTVGYMSLSVNDDDNVLHAVGIVAGSHVSVTSLDHVDGVLSTHLIAAPWIKAHHLYDNVSFCLVLLSY